MANRRRKASLFTGALARPAKSIVAPHGFCSRLVGVIVVCFSILSLGFGPPALTESDAARLPVYPGQLRLFAPVPPPRTTATAALIMDFETGRVLYEKNAHLRLAPASTTKMMTAIVALEQGRLTDKVTIEWKHLVGWASMGLWPGDVLTIEDLLWGLLLPSANEAAETIADHVGGGSVENFVKMMNDKAMEMGLDDTQFKNAHGLDEEGHYSSAYDLALIARKALQYPLINKISATRETTVYASRPFRLYNSNSLLQMQNLAPGVDGFKTGYTGDAGYCLVATTTRHGHRLITVVLGSDDRNADSIRLIDYAFANLVWEPLPVPAALKVVDETGNTRTLDIPGKRELLIRPWEKWWITLKLNVEKPPNPSEPLLPVGSATYYVGGARVVQYPLRVKE